MSDQSNYVRTALRLPPELHRKVHAMADASDRSFNDQLIHLIRMSMRDEAEAALRRLNELSEEMGQEL